MPSSVAPLYWLQCSVPAGPAVAAMLGPLLLLNPVAGARAADFNLEAIQRYSASSSRQDQVTSISQFSDVQPSEWAYQALSNLIERYGCVAGYPDGTFRGRTPLSRWEAAALLNACLDRISEATDELRRLLKEFEKELAILRGRLDNLEAKVGELEAHQFSTTTKLSGLATFVVGANAFNGTARNQLNSAQAEVGATTFSYDLQLSLDTSFTGKDLLRTILRAGNFGDSAFGGAGPTGGLSALEVAFQEASGADSLGIDKLYYQTPIGGGFTATVGGRVGQEDMLALWPSVYPTDTILNVLTLNGAPAAYNKNLGPGAGLWWQSGGFSVSGNYVAANGSLGHPNEGGLGTAASAGTGTVQIGYAGEQWALAAIYSSIQSGVEVPGATAFTASAFGSPGSHTHAFGLSGYWQPAASGWWPSISAGWGINSTSSDGQAVDGELTTSQSWMVGLQWSDVLLKGNAAGMAVGQPVFATALQGGATAQDQNVVWEWWYRFQVSDSISITPALFYLSRPLGQGTPSGESFSQLGGLVKTSFQF